MASRRVHQHTVSFSSVDLVSLCMNSSASRLSNAEGSILISLPPAADDTMDLSDAATLLSRLKCSFTLSSQSPSDRLILVLPNVTYPPEALCPKRSNQRDRVELRLSNGPMTNEVHQAAPFWEVCTTPTASSSSAMSSGNWTNQTVLAEESFAFQRLYVTSGPQVDMWIDMMSAVDSFMDYAMDEFDSRSKISIYYKSFSSNDELEDDLCYQCSQNTSWAWESGICSEVALTCPNGTDTPYPTEDSGMNHVIINCTIPPEPRSELFSILMAGCIVFTIIFVSFHCSPGGSSPSRRPAAMDIMLRDDISRRGGGGLGGGRAPFGNTSYKVAPPTVGKGPIAHV